MATLQENSKIEGTNDNWQFSDEPLPFALEDSDIALTFDSEPLVSPYSMNSGGASYNSGADGGMNTPSEASLYGDYYSLENAVKAAKEAKAAQEAKAAREVKAAQEAKAAMEAKSVQEAKAALEAKATQEAKAAQEVKAAQEAKVAKAAQEAKAALEAKVDREAKAALEAKFTREAKVALKAKAVEAKAEQVTKALKAVTDVGSEGCTEETTDKLELEKEFLNPHPPMGLAHEEPVISHETKGRHRHKKKAASHSIAVEEHVVSESYTEESSRLQYHHSTQPYGHDESRMLYQHLEDMRRQMNFMQQIIESQNHQLRTKDELLRNFQVLLKSEQEVVLSLGTRKSETTGGEDNQSKPGGWFSSIMRKNGK